MIAAATAPGGRAEAGEGEMLRVMVVLAFGLALGGCAAKPQQTMHSISSADPKFNSPECLDIRNRALVYDDKVGERAVTGMVGGLLLGVFFLPVAASIDAAQNQEREAFNREIELRCMTNPPPKRETSTQPSLVNEPAPIR